MNLLFIINMIGTTSVIIILVVVLLLFGGKKLPELMGGIGKGMKEFKNAVKDEEEKATNAEEQKTPTKPASTKNEPLKE